MKKLRLTVVCICLLNISMGAKAQFTNYTSTGSGLPSDYVCGGVAVDASNRVWAGTDAGVSVFDGTTWTVFTTADGLPSDIISCIAVDAENHVWVGTDGDGVAMYNGSTWIKYNNTDGLCDNGIFYIACDADTAIWFGSWGSGVSRFRKGIWTTFASADGFPSDGGALASVYYINVDALNYKWFATDLGLVRFDNTTFTTFDQSVIPRLKSNFITAVASDAANNKWLGVLAKGITLLGGNAGWIANYDTLNGICNNGITGIQVNSAGYIWMGAYTKYGALIEGGITKFDTASETGISLSEDDGLVNDQVFRIALDQNDDLWIATGEGLSKYSDNLGISLNRSDLPISVFPNPAGDWLMTDMSFVKAEVIINDLSGRTLIHEYISGNRHIEVKSLSCGIYFINIMDNDYRYFGKFIKD